MAHTPNDQNSCSFRIWLATLIERLFVRPLKRSRLEGGSKPRSLADQSSPESRGAMVNLAIGFCAALLAAVAFAWTMGDQAAFLQAFATSALMFGAACLCGGLIGFLFGIPRSLQDNGATVIAPPASKAETEAAVEAGPADLAADVTVKYRRGDYIPNTNLEQISDWLTKILVGVGLTQLNSIGAGLKSLITSVAPSFGEVAYAEAFLGALLIVGVLLGFLFGYLWTRLFLIGALRYADRIGVLAEENEATRKELAKLTQEANMSLNGPVRSGGR